MSKLQRTKLLYALILALAACVVTFAWRTHVIRQWLNETEEYISQLTEDFDRQQQRNNELHNEIAMLLDELWQEPSGDASNPEHERVIEYVLRLAPERLREVFDEDVTLNPPEEFVFLPRNRILVSGQWYCSVYEIDVTLDAIFSYSLWDDRLSVSLRSYAPFGRDDWEWGEPWYSPNRHWWDREHSLEIVPVRFYDMCPNTFETTYITEYLSGEAFAGEFAYFAYKHLNRIIADAWFVDTILYVNLHRNESMRMSSGTTGEYIFYRTLLYSIASVPGIDAFVVMIDGWREATFGGHGAAFRDIYLINPSGS